MNAAKFNEINSEALAAIRGGSTPEWDSKHDTDGGGTWRDGQKITSDIEYPMDHVWVFSELTLADGSTVIYIVLRNQQR